MHRTQAQFCRSQHPCGTVVFFSILLLLVQGPSGACAYHDMLHADSRSRHSSWAAGGARTQPCCLNPEAVSFLPARGPCGTCLLPSRPCELPLPCTVPGWGRVRHRRLPQKSRALKAPKKDVLQLQRSCCGKVRLFPAHTSRGWHTVILVTVPLRSGGHRHAFWVGCSRGRQDGP